MVAFAFATMMLAGLESCRGDADFSDAIKGVTTLSAETYRADIQEIGRLVFENARVTKDRRAGLARKLDDLSRRVSGEGKAAKSRFLALESLEIARLAEVSKVLAEKPPPPILQNNWMRLRANLFDDQAWMARRAADLAPLAAVPPEKVH